MFLFWCLPITLCISLLGLLKQNTTDWVPYTAELYSFTVLEVELPRSRCQQGQFLLRPLSLACRCWPPLWVLKRSAFSLGCLCPSLLLCRHQSWHLGPTHTTSSYPKCIFKAPVSKCSHILRSWELGPQHTNFGEDTG